MVVRSRVYFTYHCTHQILGFHWTSQISAFQPISNNTGTVSQQLNFVESMRNIDNRHSLRAQLVEFIKQSICLTGTQRGSRLIQDQQLWFTNQRAGDADQLTITLGQIGDRKIPISKRQAHRFCDFLSTSSNVLTTVTQSRCWIQQLVES